MVTGIGGNVGQGILRNIISLNYDIRIFGTNTEFLSSGNHLCDHVYEVPPATHESYPLIIQHICENEKIDLIIPSTDFESYYLSMNQKKLPQIVTSPPHANKIFLDKYLTYQHFQRHRIPFAESIFPVSDYARQFDEIVIKPRMGRGSREIFYKLEDVKTADDNFFIQKRYFGSEITTAFYVTKSRQLHGHITFERELTSGTTSKCTVVFDYNKAIDHIISKMIRSFDIVGSCNIQSIVTETGDVVPFEINARVSGTNSIRSQFGFEDVKYILEEYLFDRSPEKPRIRAGSAVRILMDIIYPDAGLYQIKNKTTPHYIF